MEPQEQHQFLFDSMDEILEGAKRDLEFETYLAEEDALERAEEYKVYDVLFRVAPAFEDEYGVFAYADDPTPTRQHLNRLTQAFRESRDLEERGHINELRALLEGVQDIVCSRLNAELLSKREVQRAILSSRKGSDEMRRILIAASNELLEGEGVDANDPIDVIKAIDERKEEERRTIDNVNRRRSIQIRFDELLDLAIERRADPLYDELRSYISVFIEAGFYTLKDINVDALDDEMRLLGISESQLVGVIWRIIDEL